MWRNKQLRVFTCIVGSCNLLFLCLGSVFSSNAIVLVISICAVFDAIFFMYVRQRYIEIKNLSSYLMQVYTGHTIMDIRDNQEGELSVLKNDLYKVTQTLQNQAELLLKDKTFLADSLSDISHQLKTPLTSMTILCDLLSEENLPLEKRQIFTQQLYTQLDRMQWLIVSLLKLSRIDAKAVTFKEDTVKLKDLITCCIQPFSIMMELKEIIFMNEINDEITCIGDENWLLEAFSNILKNAVEHSFKKGTIKVSCLDNPLHTKIIIANNGLEIDEYDQIHLFDRFYKGKQATPDSIGIGLALSKTIIQHSHGQITCESNDQETKFIITFFKHVI